MIRRYRIWRDGSLWRFESYDGADSGAGKTLDEAIDALAPECISTALANGWIVQ